MDRKVEGKNKNVELGQWNPDTINRSKSCFYDEIFLKIDQSSVQILFRIHLPGDGERWGEIFIYLRQNDPVKLNNGLLEIKAGQEISASYGFGYMHHEDQMVYK